VNSTLFNSRGFTLLELITVLVILAILTATAISNLVPSRTFQMQATRDTLVAAFYSSQQKAMMQSAPVRLITSINAIDIRIDSNNDGSFAINESVLLGGVQYPITINPAQSLTSHIIDFDRLGRTSSSTIVLSQSGSSVIFYMTYFQSRY